MKKKRVETFRKIYGMVTVVYIYIIICEHVLSHTTTIFTFLHVHFLTCVLYMLAIFYVDLMYFSLVDQVEIVGSPLLHIMILPFFK